MAPTDKRGGFKEWLSGFFVTKDEIRYGMPNDSQRQEGGSQRRAEPGSFFGHAHEFAIHNSPMTSIQGNQYTTYVQGDRNIVQQIMSLLSQHIIQGAAHDSSARTPPPRCHPNTRVKLIARITTWFDGEGLPELLLWITGPAGVGKSAIVQTFAEYLAKSESLGASVFISRPNKRNNPHGIFITVAYQLATRVEAYRNFIIERLSLDPELLRGDMETQFTTFIVEPFVKKKIGAVGKRWGILLDGLDELQGEDAQCNIIQLISTFTQEHPDVPLLWIIASRPESRISNTFDDEEVHRSCWTEYVPIDSTEACEDAERFLRSSFSKIQKNFRQSVPSDWPSDTDFLKLTAAASGLFVYAEVVMRFIGDSDYADPASRFEVLLSVIDRSTAVPTKDNPFVHLDALYHEIVSSIPSTQWRITKQLFSLTLYEDSFDSILPHAVKKFQTLRGMSILFGLGKHTTYACLSKCRSTLKILNWDVAHKEKLAFLHASFSDYLKDPSRSGDFYVGDCEHVEKGIVSSVLSVWNKCSGDGIATTSVEPTWHQYCSKLDGRAPSRAIADFHAALFHDLVHCLRFVAGHLLERPVEPLTHGQLCKVNMAKLCYYFDSNDLHYFMLNLQDMPESKDMGLYRRTQLRDLKFGHLDWKEMSPANAHRGPMGTFFKGDSILHRPRSKAEFKAFVSKLEYLQERSSELRVAIFGGLPQGRVVVFFTEEEDAYYAIPYPE